MTIDILKNKTNSNNTSSAKKNAEENKNITFGKVIELHNALKSESGLERAKAMGEIATMMLEK